LKEFLLWIRFGGGVIRERDFGRWRKGRKGDGCRWCAYLLDFSFWEYIFLFENLGIIGWFFGIFGFRVYLK
jgi:hypothetical protein